MLVVNVKFTTLVNKSTWHRTWLQKCQSWRDSKSEKSEADFWHNTINTYTVIIKITKSNIKNNICHKLEPSDSNYDAVILLVCCTTLLKLLFANVHHSRPPQTQPALTDQLFVRLDFLIWFERFAYLGLILLDSNSFLFYRGHEHTPTFIWELWFIL